MQVTAGQRWAAGAARRMPIEIERGGTSVVMSEDWAHNLLGIHALFAALALFS